MQIKSWIGLKVRIKREFLISYFDDDDVERWQTNIKDCPINTFLNNAKDETFYVLQDVYGADLFRYRSREVDTDELKSSHQLILRGGQMGNYPFLWDAKYFEII